MRAYLKLWEELFKPYKGVKNVESIFPVFEEWIAFVCNVIEGDKVDEKGKCVHCMNSILRERYV